ncbi:DNA pilot protein [Flyfo microvirus Tbat2_158]|nr:DNA pilot protein [Flyfo microvirus Tbat2_158]
MLTGFDFNSPASNTTFNPFYKNIGPIITKGRQMLDNFIGTGGVTHPTEFGQDFNKLAIEEAERQRTWSAGQAQKQMDFQREMSSNQYQRAAADMKAAGLNPYLLMTGGANQASAPTGAMGSSSQAPIYDSNDTLVRDKSVMDFLARMVNSATSLVSSITKMLV